MTSHSAIHLSPRLVSPTAGHGWHGPIYVISRYVARPRLGGSLGDILGAEHDRAAPALLFIRSHLGRRERRRSLSGRAGKSQMPGNSTSKLHTSAAPRQEQACPAATSTGPTLVVSKPWLCAARPEFLRLASAEAVDQATGRN